MAIYLSLAANKTVQFSIKTDNQGLNSHTLVHAQSCQTEPAARTVLFNDLNFITHLTSKLRL